ncbi:MAG: hypothetical protein ABL961_04190 [Vicinamibacterales bacterium]
MTRVAPAAVVACLLAPPGHTAHAQSPPTRDATVAGVVIAVPGGDPVAHASLTVETTNGGQTVHTDIDGRFVLGKPAAPTAMLRVSRPGFITARVAIGRSARIELIRAAHISGRVINAFGDPMVGAVVFAAEEGGNGARVAQSETDDHGDYRLSGLRGGAFAVGVMTVGIQVPSNPQLRPFYNGGNYTLYYPGLAAGTEAAVLHLPAGDELSGIDFNVPVNPAAAPAFRDRAGLVSDQPEASQPQRTLAGQVIDADGHAVAHPQVLLEPLQSPDPPSVVWGDDDGRFAFPIDSGRSYRLVAAKYGYVQPQPTRLDVARADVTVTVRLNRLGTLTGRVLDDSGDPIEGAVVQCWEQRFDGDALKLVPLGRGYRSNDRGEYRLHSLRSGTYAISALPTDGRTSIAAPGFARTFFPGTTEAAQARLVALDNGAELSGLDVILTRRATARVSGRLLNAAGAGTTTALTLRPRDPTKAVDSFNAEISPDGSFVFPSVAPGHYVIRADKGGRSRSDEGEFVALPVLVEDTDITGLTVQLSTGSTLRGRLSAAASTAAPPRWRGVEISWTRVDPDLSSSSQAVAELHSDGSFAMSGLHGPRRIKVSRLPPGWALESVRLGGRDVTDDVLWFGSPAESSAEVEIELTDRLSRLSGTVTDGRGRPLANTPVIVVSTNAERWYRESRFMQLANTDARGAFVITGLPPDTYLVLPTAQLPQSGADGWRDPRFLQGRLAGPGSLAVILGREQSASVVLTLPSR